MIWDGEVDDWVFDEDDDMNEGVSGDDEKISLWVLDLNLLVLLQGEGRGNSNGGIQKISLYDLVNIREEGKWEETLAWENSDSSWDKKMPCKLWIKDWTSRVSAEEC